LKLRAIHQNNSPEPARTRQNPSAAIAPLAIASRFVATQSPGRAGLGCHQSRSPINFDKAIASAVAAAIVSGVFSTGTGDNFEDGTPDAEDKKKVFEFLQTVVSQGVGISVDNVYDHVVNIIHNM
jgi:hypothetical protein